MRPPLVSVNLCTYRPHPSYLRQAVASVRSQTWSDWELVIVEDPSPVSIREVLGHWLEDPRVLLLRNRERQGLLRQKNQALQASRGQFVAVLDHDDVAEPHRLATQVAYLQTHPEVHAVGSWVLAIDEQGTSFGMRRYPTGTERVRRALRRFSPLAHPATMFRRESVLALGGYTWSHPSDPLGLVSDYELWSRMAKAGLALDNIPEVLLRYRVHRQAQKRERAKAILRATLAVKTIHWREEFDGLDWLRYLGEHALLCLPAGLLWRLFLVLSYRRKRERRASYG